MTTDTSSSERGRPYCATCHDTDGPCEHCAPPPAHAALPIDPLDGRPFPNEREAVTYAARRYRIAPLAPDVVAYERGGEIRGRVVQVLFGGDDRATIRRAGMWLPKFGAALVDPAGTMREQPDAAVIASPEDAPGVVLSTVLAWLETGNPRALIARAAGTEVHAAAEQMQGAAIAGAVLDEIQLGDADPAPWSRGDADPLEDMRRAGER